MRLVPRYGILQKRAFTQAVREKVPLIINFSQIISETRALDFSHLYVQQNFQQTRLITSRQDANVLSHALQSSASFWASCTSTWTRATRCGHVGLCITSAISVGERVWTLDLLIALACPRQSP